MANTYKLIASSVLTTSANSVTFSSIPSTYTDLALKVSTRTSSGATRGTIRVFPNSENSSSTNGSYTVIYVTGTTKASGRASNTVPFRNLYDSTADGATASTFGSAEFYLPNYSSSQYKVLQSFGNSETNATTGSLLGAGSSLWQSTAAISQLVVDGNTDDFLAGSSFYLYGILNS